MAHGMSSASRSWARAGSAFGAVMLMILGAFQVLEGVVAIVRSSFFTAIGHNYLYDMSTRGWGIVHVVVGGLAFLAGFFVFTGSIWARAIGIVLASASAISNFFFIPYYPVWSVLIIALNVFVIWSLATINLRAEQGMGRRYGEPYPGERESYPRDAMSTSGQRWPQTNQPTGRTWSDEQRPMPAAPGEAPDETPASSGARRLYEARGDEDQPGPGHTH